MLGFKSIRIQPSMVDEMSTKVVSDRWFHGSWWSVGYNLGLNHRGLWRVFPYAYELLECVKGPRVHKRFLFHLVQAVYLTVVGGGRSAGGKFQPFLYFLAISSSFFSFFLLPSFV